MSPAAGHVRGCTASNPLTATWFERRFDAATPAQLEAWPRIRAGGDVLISAPTGSGKTLAAFLSCLDRLVALAAGGGLEDRTAVVYVSPLKALSSDIHRNLQEPLGEIAALAAAGGRPYPEIRTAIRTGDTPAWDREQMVRRPPHIVVTTPESLFILLTAERSRRMLSTAETVIVDEIHALIDDKRGSHLALSLARLDDLAVKFGGARLQRIGLSATVKPIGEVARFLTGVSAGAPASVGPGAANDTRPEEEEPAAAASSNGSANEWPPVAIVDFGHRRELDVAVEVPQDELGVVATNEMWGEIYDRIADLVRAHRTTIVFVNTRRLSERVAHQLAERLGEDAVLAHHGSLSRQLRQTAEAALKDGRLRAVVATASLELGIDVGSVDLVCQIGTPRSIAVALQRIGRSGHKVDRAFVPKGRFFATTRDELIECAALVRAIRRGLLDERRLRPWPRDVLAQQIVAAAATADWQEDDLFALARSTAPYRDLPRAEFDAVVAMLSDGIASPRGRHGTWLHRDRVNGVVRGRRGARLAAITSGGAIPDNANYLVVAEPEGTTVGTVDEDFAVESMAGDIFLLGTTSWRIRRVESGRLRVEDAHGAAPSVPFWLGEAPGRTAGALRGGVGGPRAASRTRRRVPRRRRCGAVPDPRVRTRPVRRGAGRGLRPRRRRRARRRAVHPHPGGRTLLRRGGRHAARAARAARGGRQPRLGPGAAQAVLPELQRRAAGRRDRQRHRDLLVGAAQFSARGRVPLPAPRDARRGADAGDAAGADVRGALALERVAGAGRAAFRGGRKVPPPLLRMRSDDLLAAVFPDQVACQENLTGDIRIPEHPLVDETIRDCLHEAMDLNGLRADHRGRRAGHDRDAGRSTPPSRRRSGTRSSTPIRMRFSTTRRWRSGGRARCSSAARWAMTAARSGRSTPRRSPRSRPSRGRWCAIRKSCTTRS